jgi:hypothetical protein
VACTDVRRIVVRHRSKLLFPLVCAALLMLALSACSFSASTAKIGNAKMAHDKNGKQPTKAFSPNDTFYCVADLSNAPNDTTVKAVWTAVDVQGVKPDTKIKQVSTKSGSGQLQFNLSNNSPWPVGVYKVDLFLNDAKKPTETLKFEVK